MSPKAKVQNLRECCNWEGAGVEIHNWHRRFLVAVLFGTLISLFLFVLQMKEFNPPHHYYVPPYVEIDKVQKRINKSSELVYLISSNIRPNVSQTEICLRGNASASRPPCTFSALRKRFKQFKQFSECGHWAKNGKDEQFQPDICRFLPVNLKQCLLQRNIHSLLIIGDSNALRYYYAWVSWLSQAGECRKINREETLKHGRSVPEASYYARGDPELQHIIEVQARACRTCMSQAQLCILSENETLKIEYTTLYDLNDTSITIKQTSEVPLAKSSLEFLFKVYLQRNYPDVIFFHPPFNHEKKYDAGKVQKKIEAMLRIISKYKPTETQIIWLPCQAEFEPRKYKRWKNRRFNGLLATDNIYILNRLLFDNLESFFVDSHSKMNGFFNLVNISLDRMKWTTDGIHYKPIWYSNIVHYIASLVCTKKVAD